jgi:hypothetical protein
MSAETERSRILVQEIASRCRAEMIPLTSRFSYFSLAPMAEEDLRQYLHDPIAALPPAICAALPEIGVVLSPYLEKGNGKSGDTACFEKPAETRSILTSAVRAGDLQALVFATRDIEVADYHYHFYSVLAGLIAGSWPLDVQEQFYRILREELGSEMHGEVDEKSWHLKQALMRRQSNTRKETKLFREYARQAFEDTLTLYLHGTCCDIDVDTGPRQMPSRYLRRRIESLMAIYPPPEGYAVLPEQLKSR